MKYLKLYKEKTIYDAAIGVSGETNTDTVQPCISICMEGEEIKGFNIIGDNVTLSRTILDENNQDIKLK